MSESVEVLLPKLGESIVGATIVHWLKKVGDPIAVDEGLVEVATDKVNSEIPSPVSGILSEILAPVEAELLVGAPLARIRVSTSVPSVTEAPSFVPAEAAVPLPSSQEPVGFLSPAVLRLAQTEGLSLSVLQGIAGSGEGGRVSKRDVERYLAQQNKRIMPPPPACPLASQEERIPLTGMRKAIADNMVRSFYAAPHASVVHEVDVTDTLRVIAQEKDRFLATHGVKLTITAFLLHAMARTLQNYPMLNASLEEETIVLKKQINIGMAVHIDRGLVVPVLKHCEHQSIVHLAKGIADLAARARTGKLAPDEIAEGTVTLTNFGMTGALIGVPIIRYPEVAILGAGTIQKRVVVREDDSFAIRQMLYLTLTFDHRVVDGVYGCSFLGALKGQLEASVLEG